MSERLQLEGKVAYLVVGIVVSSSTYLINLTILYSPFCMNPDENLVRSPKTFMLSYLTCMLYLSFACFPYHLVLAACSTIRPLHSVKAGLAICNPRR